MPPLQFPLRRRPPPPPSPATVTTGPLVEDSGMGDVRPPPGEVWPGLPSIASFPTCFKEKKVPFSYFLTQRAATVRRARSITRRAVRGFPFLSPRMAPPRRPAGRLSPGLRENERPACAATGAKGHDNRRAGQPAGDFGAPRRLSKAKPRAARSSRAERKKNRM